MLVLMPVTVLVSTLVLSLESMMVMSSLPGALMSTVTVWTFARPPQQDAAK